MFVPFALVIAGITIFAVRRWESSLCWERYRVSTAIWLFLGEIEQVGGACLSGAMVGMIYYLVVRKVSEHAPIHTLPSE
ncbi:MAG: hypothetical protein VCA34_15150 [Roseibacillus sp.]